MNVYILISLSKELITIGSKFSLQELGLTSVSCVFKQHTGSTCHVSMNVVVFNQGSNSKMKELLR